MMMVIINDEKVEQTSSRGIINQRKIISLDMRTGDCWLLRKISLKALKHTRTHIFCQCQLHVCFHSTYKGHDGQAWLHGSVKESKVEERTLTPFEFAAKGKRIKRYLATHPANIKAVFSRVERSGIRSDFCFQRVRVIIFAGIHGGGGFGEEAVPS